MKELFKDFGFVIRYIIIIIILSMPCAYLYQSLFDEGKNDKHINGCKCKDEICILNQEDDNDRDTIVIIKKKNFKLN